MKTVVRSTAYLENYYFTRCLTAGPIVTNTEKEDPNDILFYYAEQEAEDIF